MVEPLYIINFGEVVYHQNEVMYIIKSQRNTPSVMIYTLKRDDIRLTAMIYQVCDLDKKIGKKNLPIFLWIRGESPLVICKTVCCYLSLCLANHFGHR